MTGDLRSGYVSDASGLDVWMVVQPEKSPCKPLFGHFRTNRTSGPLMAFHVANALSAGSPSYAVSFRDAAGVSIVNQPKSIQRGTVAISRIRRQSVRESHSSARFSSSLRSDRSLGIGGERLRGGVRTLSRPTRALLLLLRLPVHAGQLQGDRLLRQKGKMLTGPLVGAAIS